MVSTPHQINRPFQNLKPTAPIVESCRCYADIQRPSLGHFQLFNREFQLSVKVALVRLNHTNYLQKKFQLKRYYETYLNSR